MKRYETSNSMGKIGCVCAIIQCVRAWWLSSDASTQSVSVRDEPCELVLNESTSGKLPVGIKLLNKWKYIRMVDTHCETKIIGSTSSSYFSGDAVAATVQMYCSQYTPFLAYILCMRIIITSAFFSLARFVWCVVLACRRRLLQHVYWTCILLVSPHFVRFWHIFARLASISAETANQNVIHPTEM